MAVNKNIGFFHEIIEKVNVFANKNDMSIRPPILMANKANDYNTLKSKAIAKDSYGSDNVFHWGSHKWGDPNHFVGQ